MNKKRVTAHIFLNTRVLCGAKLNNSCIDISYPSSYLSLFFFICKSKSEVKPFDSDRMLAGLPPSLPSSHSGTAGLFLHCEMLCLVFSAHVLYCVFSKTRLSTYTWPELCLLKFNSFPCGFFFIPSLRLFVILVPFFF